MASAVTEEAAQIIRWRTEVLEGLRDRAGGCFTKEQVDVLAHGACDLHEAEDLLTGGCPVLIAFDILS